MPSYAGPMVSADFGNESSAGISQFTYQHFIQAVINKKLDIQVEHTQEFYTGPPIEFRKKILWGGNLSMLVSLLGTPYFPSMETIHQGILFIEDINEHPYRVERMLLQLVQAKVLSSQSAILVGDFSGYQLGPLDADYSLIKALGRVGQELHQQGTGTTIISGLPFGHCLDKVTLPVGISCDLELSTQGFKLSGSW
jgi:muramoyltetrapeptide carboxypeptidase